MMLEGVGSNELYSFRVIDIGKSRSRDDTRKDGEHGRKGSRVYTVCGVPALY